MKQNFLFLYLIALIFFLAGCGHGVNNEHPSQKTPQSHSLGLEKSADNQTLLTWKNDYDAQSYIIYLSTDAEFPTELTQKITTVEPVLQLDFGLPGDIYYIKIAGMWANKEGASSETFQFSVPFNTPVSKQSAEQIELSWALEADNFNVYWSSDPNLSVDNYEGVINVTDANSFAQSKDELANIDNIYYLVTALVDSVERPITEVINIEVSVVAQSPTSLGAPGDIQVETKETALWVSWSAVESAESYTVYRQTNDQLDIKQATVFQNVSSPFRDDSVTNDQEYYYWVVAENSQTTSDFSAVSEPSSLIIKNPIETINEPPIFMTPSEVRVDENTLEIVELEAIDPEGKTILFSLASNSDPAIVLKNERTLEFTTAQDYEALSNQANDRSFRVDVIASDGVNEILQTLVIGLGDVDEVPELLTSAELKVSENNTAIRTLSASDPENKVIQYQIVGGNDDSHFNIDSNGLLSFTSAADFEIPLDHDTDNVYQVEIEISDGSNSLQQLFHVQVTAFDDAPAFTSAVELQVPENSRDITSLSANDVDSDSLEFNLVNNTSNLFAIENGNQLVFLKAPDYESAISQFLNNQYSVEISVTDGVNLVTQRVDIEIIDVNEAPRFLSDASNPEFLLRVPENSIEIASISAEDPEGQDLSFSLAPDSDANITLTGENNLEFVLAQDYESATNQDNNHTFEVVVIASDGVTQASQLLTVVLTDINEAPIFTSTDHVTIPEGTSAQTEILTLIATDVDTIGSTLTFATSAIGGADNNQFVVTTDGEVRFAKMPDFESPTDSNEDNVYMISVSVSDGVNETNQEITLVVTDIPENNPPSISGIPNNSVNEGELYSFTPTASDLDSDTLVFDVINKPSWVTDFDSTTGKISGIPGFDSAGIYGGIEISVADGKGGTSSLPIFSITVNNIDDHGNSADTASVMSIGSQLAGIIEEAGDIDYFRVTVTETGQLSVYSTGSTNTFGHLFNNAGAEIKSNDDGASANFSIVQNVSPGTYYVKVRHSNGSGTGSYVLHSTFTLLDSDDDGVVNNLDQCPGTSAGATVDGNGCAQAQLDSDVDGVTNDLDQCPGTAAGATVDVNGCAEAQLDTDVDGVTNDLDQCPGTAAGATVDGNGCAQAQLDSDVDGVTNDLDQCPETLAGETVDANGCSPSQLSGGVNNGEFAYVHSIGNNYGNISGGDRIFALTTDTFGNVYQGGQFQGVVDFDPGPNVYEVSSAPGSVGYFKSAYLVKTNADGTLAWVWYTEGYSESRVHYITTDEQANIYIVGEFDAEADFDPDPVASTILTAISTTQDIFVAKLNSSGQLIWVKKFNGFGEDWASGIALDGNNNIYISGRYDGGFDFNPSPTEQALPRYTDSTFVVKISAAGNYVWHYEIGTPAYAGNGLEINDFSVSNSGDTILAGRYEGALSFDINDTNQDGDTAALTPVGNFDVYALQLNTNGQFQWIWSAGGLGYDVIHNIDVNEKSIYLTGTGQNDVDFNLLGGGDPKSAVGYFPFLTHLDINGNYQNTQMIYGENIWAQHIERDSLLNTYISGYFTDTAAFDPATGNDVYTTTSPNGQGFISKFSPDGSYLWTKILNTKISLMEMDKKNNLYLSGYYSKTVDFDPGPAIKNITSVGGNDIYLLLLSPNPGDYSVVNY